MVEQPAVNRRVTGSSPVSGANSVRHFEHVSLKNLSLNLSGSDQVAQALQQAGEALIAAASAIRGRLLSLPTNSLSLTPARPEADNVTVSELLSEFLRAKARQDRSDRYLRQMRVSLLSFAKGRKNIRADNVTIEEVETWVHGQGWAARTKDGYLTDVRTMYNWGMRRNLVARNPALAVELPEYRGLEPGIFSPDQVRTILEFARGYDLNVCRALAIQFFAGLRSSEVVMLEEPEIRLEEKLIEVRAEKAKTRRRRLVAIQPNLRAWIELGGKLPLHAACDRWHKFHRALEKEKQISWVKNGPRHSFVSYHVAQFGSAAKTALEAGHTEQMTFAHYRALVTPSSAAEYWGIVPKRRSRPAESPAEK
jgi:integrase